MTPPLILAAFSARLRWAYVLIVAVGLYAGMGAYGIPYLATARWLPDLARQTGLDLGVAKLEFDPFGFGARIDGLTVKNRDGRLLMTVRGLQANLDLWSTLREGRPALSVELDAPILALARNDQGRWNWPEAMPRREEEHKPFALPLALARFTVAAGKLDISDALAAKPLATTTLEDIRLELTGLHGKPNEHAPVRIDAAGPDGERIALDGAVSLDPLSLTGTAALERLNLPFWARLLKPDPAWRLEGGRLSARLHFTYPASAPPGVGVETGALELTGLSVANRDDGTRRFGIGRLALDRLELGPVEPVLSLAGLSVAKAESPWFRLDSLSADKLTANIPNPGLDPDAPTLENLESATGNLAQPTIGTVSPDVVNQLARVERLTADRLEATPWGTLTGLSLEDMSYDWKDRHLTFARLEADQADGRWGRVMKPRLTEVSFEPGARFTLESASARTISGSWGDSAEPRLGRTEYRLADRRLISAGLGLSQTVTVWGRTSGIMVRELDVALNDPLIAMGELAMVDADLPAARAAKVSASNLRYSAKDRRLTLAAGRLEHAQTPDLQLDHLEWEDLSYAVNARRFQVKSALLTGAATRRPVENQATSEAAAAKSAQQPGNVESRGATTADVDRYAPRRARLGSLRVEDGQGGLDGRFFTARRVATEASELDIIRRKDRTFEIRGLPHQAGPAMVDVGSQAPWTLNIDECRFENYSIHFFDETTEPPVRLRFNGLSLNVFDLGNDAREDMEFRLRSRIGESSRIEVEGRLHLDPFRSSFRFGLDKLRMRSVEPYWKPLTSIDLQRGNLSLWGDVVLRQESGLKFDYAGGAEILEFDSVDRPHRQPVLKWDKLKFDGLAISTQPPRFVTRILSAEQPQARVALDEKRELNLWVALKPPSTAAIPRELEALRIKETPRNQLPSVSIGLLRIQDGIVNFSDRSLKPGFAANISKFNGSVSGLTSRIDALASGVLEGRLNGNLPVRVFGEVDPMDYRDHTDVAMSFKGLNLTMFSAYSGKFGGYRIEKGKLDMDLRYRVMQGLVDVENRAVLDKLTLGERVDDSGSWLVDLAIALLKSSDGKIDLNLPVYGDLTNPQFSLWLLYRDVLTGLLAKFVLSPASLVEAALSNDEATPYAVPFAPGESEVSESSGALLKSLAKTMQARPGANLDIQGRADPRQDRLALAEQALLERLKAARRVELRARGVRLRGAPVPDLSDEDYRRLFTAYYRDQHPNAPELRALDGDHAMLSGHSFSAARNKALWEWPIDETTLRALAQERAENIRGYLLDNEGIPDEDIFLLDVKLEHLPSSAIAVSLMLAES